MSSSPASEQATGTTEVPGTSAPPKGKKFPCPKCGARLDFDPAARSLKCPYCGHAETIASSPEQVRERDWDAYWSQQAGEETVLTGHSTQVRCQACAAIVLLEDKVATDRCPYCGTHLENDPESAKGMIAPDGVLPFSVSRRQAVEAFNQWIGSRWFAPNTLQNFANLGQLAGVYIPYWTFDSMTYSYFTGQRGDNHTRTVTYTETDSNGQTQTRTRTEVYTVWTPVSGEVQHFFDDVLVCASQSLPKEFVCSLEPWDLDRLEGFKPDFLSGFQTERYAVGLKDGFEEARGIMDGHIRELCRRQIGGDHQRVEHVQTQHVGVTFKHVLLPVWLAAYRYQDRPYRILINARTGEVVGSRPYSAIKIVLFVLAILMVLLSIFMLARSLGAAPPGPQAPRVQPLSEAWGTPERETRTEQSVGPVGLFSLNCPVVWTGGHERRRAA